jgi:membrane-associated protease RseP (regulator of RpoE activity)
MRKLFEQLQQNFPQLPNNLPQIQGGGITISRPGDNRLGGRLTKPNDTLAEQLNLPRGKGLVLDNVKDNSAASKAGLKNHDILLEVGGQAVPSNINEFNKILDGIKAKTPVDVVVLRKGKNETIKGLELPEAQKGIIGGLKVQPIKLKPLKVQPLPAGKVLPVIPGGVTRGMSITRNNDEFTARYTEGNVTITVIGKIEGGKTTVSNVEVKDGDKTNNYKSVEAVPESFRADVRELIRQVERGGVRVPGKD